MNQIKVLFFATYKDIVGSKQISLEVSEETNVSDLRIRLIQKYPELNGKLETAVISINRKFSVDTEMIPLEAEIAIFPPVSGGSGSDYPTICTITNDEIDIDDLIRQITLPTTGAVCSFTGIVRAETKRDHPHQTKYLEYEAYEPMAQEKLYQIASEIRTKWTTIEGIALVQRIGHLNAGAVSVVIACSAAHRDTGVFDAAHYGIDRLKEIVPIWKKEITPQGKKWVEGKYQPKHDD
jgi:MoaE-MoaD fusion protein